nr:serine/arginine repetitive matrix protein 1-like [Microcebus murinus]
MAAAERRPSAAPACRPRERPPLGASSRETGTPLRASHPSPPPAPSPASAVCRTGACYLRFDGEQEEAGGIGPTESASRRRREAAVEREDERPVSGGCEEGAPPRTRGNSLARSPAQLRRSRRRRNCAPQLRATDLHARPGESAAAAATARAAPPRTSPRAPPLPPTPPSRFRLEALGKSQASARKTQRQAPPRRRPRPPPAPPVSAGARSFPRSSTRHFCSWNFSLQNPGSFHCGTCQSTLGMCACVYTVLCSFLEPSGVPAQGQ